MMLSNLMTVLIFSIIMFLNMSLWMSRGPLSSKHSITLRNNQNSSSSGLKIIDHIGVQMDRLEYREFSMKMGVMFIMT